MEWAVGEADWLLDPAKRFAVTVLCLLGTATALWITFDPASEPQRNSELVLKARETGPAKVGTQARPAGQAERARG